MPSFLTLPVQSDGFINDLLDEQTFTLCNNDTYFCPGNKSHIITRNKDKLFCEDCGIWWHRNFINLT